jgi:hypothetical protein
MSTVLRGSQPEQGEAVAEMVECPMGRCVVCGQTGLVKRVNLERARENDEWSMAALRRLLSLALVTPDDSIDWEWMASHGDG